MPDDEQSNPLDNEPDVSSGPSDAPDSKPLLLSQEEIERALDAAEVPTERRLTVEQLLSGPAPTIEKEPIDDPELVSKLMGETSSEETGASEGRDSGSYGQDEADAPIAAESRSESAKDSDASSQKDDLENIDEYMEAIASTEAPETSDEPLAPGAESDEPLVDSNQAEDQVLESGGAASQADVDALVAEAAVESQGSGSTRTEPPDSIDVADVGGENVAAAGASEDESAISQDMLDSLIAEAEAEGGTAPAEHSAGVAEPKTGDTDTEELSPDLLEEIAAEASAPAAEPIAEEASGETVRDAESRRAGVAGDWGSSRNTLRDAIRENPLRFAAAALAGIIGFSFMLAILRANPVRPVDPEDIADTVRLSSLETAMARAEELIGAGSGEEAAQLLEDAIAAAPPSPLRSDAEFLRLEAEMASIEDTVTAARADSLHRKLDRAVEDAPLHPRAPEALLWKAELYLAENNPLAARSTLREALEEYPDSENYDALLLSAGQLELEMDNAVQAADRFQSLIDRFPASPHVDMARLHIGDAFRMARNYDDARTTYVRIAQSRPGTQAGRLAFERLGEVAFETGDYESAIRELESRLNRATSVEGNDGVYLLLAKTYRASGDPDTARTLLNELIAFFPDSDVIPLAYVELANLESEGGDLREAVRIISRARDRYPEHPSVLRTAGEFFERTEQYHKAADAFTNAYAAGGKEDPLLLLNAGRAYRQADMLETALDTLRQLETEHPATDAAKLGTIEWAEVMYERGAIGDAVDRLEMIVRVNDNPEVRRQSLTSLAKIYQDAGLVDEAVRSYVDLAEVSSDPGVLADSAIALIEAKAWDAGLRVSEEVNAGELPPAKAYDFLIARGTALLKVDPRRALETLDDAYVQYPDQRSAAGDLSLLRANLASERSARARAIVTDMAARYSDSRDDRALFEQASNEWGDFLFNRRDYRAAAEAYRTTLGDSVLTMETGGDPTPPSSERRAWALYQRANALEKLSEFGSSLALYERVAASDSPWADEADRKSEAVRLELRLRGEGSNEIQEAG